eukprot:4127622-Prymnesium_polylepis.2
MNLVPQSGLGACSNDGPQLHPPTPPDGPVYTQPPELVVYSTGDRTIRQGTGALTLRNAADSLGVLQFLTKLRRHEAEYMAHRPDRTEERDSSLKTALRHRD